MFGTGSTQYNPEKKLKLYVILLINESEGEAKLFQYIGTAFDENSVAIKALENMRKTIPALWDFGIKNGGFKVKLQSCFEREAVDRIFGEEEKKQNIITEIIEAPEPVTEKSILIKSVIDRNDIGYLHEKRFEFTEYEYQYIKEKIYASQHQDPNS